MDCIFITAFSIKDIAQYYGCDSTTIGYWVRNLKNFMYLIKIYVLEIQIIQNFKE